LIHNKNIESVLNVKVIGQGSHLERGDRSAC